MCLVPAAIDKPRWLTFKRGMATTLPALLAKLRAYESAGLAKLKAATPSPLPHDMLTGYVHFYSVDLPTVEGAPVAVEDHETVYPVIVAVGINYTQHATEEASLPFDLWKDSGLVQDAAMRSAAKRALAAYARNPAAWTTVPAPASTGGNHAYAARVPPAQALKNFILVAVNPYPFITREKWPSSISGDLRLKAAWWCTAGLDDLHCSLGPDVDLWMGHWRGQREWEEFHTWRQALNSGLASWMTPYNLSGRGESWMRWAADNINGYNSRTRQVLIGNPYHALYR